MATFARTQRFNLDAKRLSSEQRARFQEVILGEFVVDLKVGQFRPRLRVKRVVSTAAIWEMTWASDGRATFEYGPPQRPGEPHVVWRRIGSHEVFRSP